MRKALSLVPAVILGWLAATPTVFADSIPLCTPNISIASLQQSGGCVSGGLFYSNFQYHNGGLQISPGVYVTPSNVLVNATPFSITFSTDYGLNGGFTNCLSGSNAVCIEEEGSLGYAVSALPGSLAQIAGLGLFGGDVPGLFGGHVAAIGCLGTGNSANPMLTGSTGYQDDSTGLCSEPSESIVLNGKIFQSPGYTPSTALFSPVSDVSVAMSLFVELALAGHPSNIPPFSNAFLLVAVPEPSTLLLLGTGLAGLLGWRRRSIRRNSAPRAQ